MSNRGIAHVPPAYILRAETKSKNSILLVSLSKVAGLHDN